MEEEEEELRKFKRWKQEKAMAIKESHEEEKRKKERKKRNEEMEDDYLKNFNLERELLIKLNSIFSIFKSKFFINLLLYLQNCYFFYKFFT